MRRTQLSGRVSPYKTSCQARAAGCHCVIPPAPAAPSSRPAALPTSCPRRDCTGCLPPASASVTHLDQRRRGSGSQCFPGFAPCDVSVSVCVRLRACVPEAQQPLLPCPLPFYSSSEPAQSPRCIVGEKGCSAGRAVADGRQEEKLTAEGQEGGTSGRSLKMFSHKRVHMEPRGLEKCCGLFLLLWLSAARSRRLHLTLVQHPTRLALVESNPPIAKPKRVVNGMENFCCSLSLAVVVIWRGEILDLLRNIYSTSRVAYSPHQRTVMTSPRVKDIPRERQTQAFQVKSLLLEIQRLNTVSKHPIK